MALDLRLMNEEVQLPPELIIELVDDAETLRLWYRVFNQVYGLPDFVKEAWIDSFASVGWDAQRPLCCYLAWLKGRPVATSFVVLRAGVAGIYGVGTLSEARGQEIGTAVTRIPLHHARDLGYRVGVLRSSETGYSVYRKMGLCTYCDMGLYVRAAA